MKNTLLVLLLFVVSFTIQSQNTISGVITDSETSEGLSFANIYLPQLEQGAIADESGFFSIKNLPNGNYKIVYSFIGYETHSTNISLPLSEDLKVQLKTSAIEMEEVIVSTPFHKLQSDNVMKVERANINELKQEGAVTLADGITEIPGVSSVTTGLGIGKPVIRGLSSNRVLVYTQGVRLENQQYGSEHGLGLSDAGVESVEVIKGPASLLYGSDALGGVLYLNPERFVEQNSTSLDGSFNYFTNTEGFNTNIGYKASGEYFKVIIRGSLTEHADYDTEDFRVTNSRFKEQDFKGSVGYQKSNFKTEFRYNLNASQLGLPEEIGIQNTDKEPMLPRQDINNHVFSSKSSFFFDNSSLDINLGYIYNDRKEFEEHHHHDDEHEDEDHDDDEDHEEDEEEHDEEDEDHDADEEAALHMKLKTFNYDIKYNLPTIGRFEAIVGVQGMHQTNTNYGEEILIPNATTNDFGVLATTHIHFDKVDIQLGARFDNRQIKIENGIERNFNSFNAAIGAKTDITENTIARLNLASGFRAPNLAELASDGTHEGTNRYEIGNPNLNYEQNLQVDLALEHKTQHFEVFANAFYNNVSDYIFLEPNGEFINGDPVFVYNQDNAYLYGGEFGFHFHPHPLDWLHFESSFETVTGKLDNDDYLPLIPANSLNNTLRVEFETDKVKGIYSFVRLNSVFEQNNVSNFETSTDSYNLLSAGIGGTLNVFSNPMAISITATNILDKVYINHLSRLKADGIPNMGRNFSFGIRYSM